MTTIEFSVAGRIFQVPESYRVPTEYYQLRPPPKRDAFFHTRMSTSVENDVIWFELPVAEAVALCLEGYAIVGMD